MGFESSRSPSVREKMRKALHVAVAAAALASGQAEGKEIKLPQGVNKAARTLNDNVNKKSQTVHIERTVPLVEKGRLHEGDQREISQEDLNTLVRYLALTENMQGAHVDSGKEMHQPAFQKFCHELSIFCQKFADRNGRSAYSRELYKTISTINNEVNASISPEADIEQYGVNENWTIPDKSGDCEDYVLLKMIRLIDKGDIDPKYLHIVIVWDEKNEGHAVLGVDVFLNGVRNTLILDNKFESIITLDAMDQKYQGTMVSFLAASSQGGQSVRFFDYKSARAVSSR